MTGDDDPDRPVRRLHIGGRVTREGWEILNIQPGPGVDHVADAADLSEFADATFAEVYASHVLEHLDYMDKVLAALTEWRRVLHPGGRLYVGVPDLGAVARLLSAERVDPNDQMLLVRVIFGGHMDPYDYHQTAFTQDILVGFLTEAGYTRLRRVPSFGLFEDTSLLAFKGTALSINIVAEKPGP